MLTGSGRCASSLKALRSRIRARISNCLPTDREKDVEMMKIKLMTSRPRIRVKASWMALKWLWGVSWARAGGSMPCRLSSTQHRAAT